MNQLSATIRKQVFLDFNEERTREAAIVDFEIDGRSIREMVKSPAAPQLPKFDPGEQFVGVSLSSLQRRIAAYRSGFHTAAWPRLRNLVGLTACEGCGERWCGGVWTKIHAGRERVSWSGLVFSNEVELGQLHRPETFVFERAAYDRLFLELEGREPELDRLSRETA